ncbi:MAG TPA: hypothetical protein VEU77_12640, partial [Candidatus Acidoferrales bacterium]|nr:hypothetical protein [Candidatus Acidoferrales bacterium]
VLAAHGDMEVVREIAHQAGNEPDSPATRDLAVTRAPPPPAGVVRLDLRESTDAFVTKWDARDPGVPSRILQTTQPSQGLPNGHGAILTDPNAIDLTIRTITTRRVPPDERSQGAIADAEAESNRWSRLALIGICLVTALVMARALNRWSTKAIIAGARLLGWKPPERCP